MSFSRKKSSELEPLSDQKVLKSHSQVGVSAGQLQTEESFSNKILETHRGILARLMPSEADKAIEKFKSDLIETQATSRLELFRQYKEFQRQSLRDTLDALLAKGKIGLRGETAEFFATQYRELETSVTQIVNDFLDDCEKRLEDAESSKNELIKKRKIQIVENRIEEFTQAVDILMARFSDIIKEGV